MIRPRIRALARVPSYPVLIVVTYVLAKLLASYAPLDVVVRPLAILIPTVLLVQVVASLPAGRERGSFVLAVVLVAAIDPLVALLLLAAATVPLVWVSVVHRRVQALNWAQLTGFINVVAAMTLLITVGNGVLSGGFHAAPVARSTSIVAAAPPDAPDIYLMLLDAYPRADTLEEDFGYDNSNFLDSMTALGFDVAEASRSNYNQTALTLASMLNARHIDELLPSPARGLRLQVQQLGELINHGSALAEARRRGYEVVSFAFPAQYLTLHAADEVIDTGQMNVFEYSLTQTESLRRVLPEMPRVMLDQHRARIQEVFAGLNQVAALDSPRPRIVFTHVAAPHPPFAFNADGSASSFDECTFEACQWSEPLRSEQVAAVIGNVQHLNTLVLNAARTIIDKSVRPAVIVVFSDHGLRHDPNDLDESFRSLLLARTPGQPGLFPENANPINIFPRLLNAYAGSDMPLQSKVSYWTPQNVATNGFLPLQAWSPQPAP